MDDLIQQGVNALKSGDRENARKLLAQAIKQNPDNERAWQWMFNASNNDKERISCLQQILRINPQNEKASQILGELIGADFPLEQPSPHPATTGIQATAEQKPSSMPAVQVEKPVVSQQTPAPNQRKTLLIVVGAILFVCFIGLCFSSLLGGTGGGNPTPTVFTASEIIPFPIATNAGGNTGSSDGSCCKICGANSQPCGDSCISLKYICHKGPGCACK